LSDFIYQCLDPRDYLSFVYEEKKRNNPLFSIRSWSQKVGYKNSDFLSKILRKERTLTPKQAEAILPSLNLKDDKKNYFNLLVLYANAKSDNEKEVYIDLLKSMNSDLKEHCFSVDYFKCMSDWQYTAILEMTKLKDFRNDPQWIQKKFGGALTIQEIKKSIDVLIKVKLLKLSDDGKLEKMQRVKLYISNGSKVEAIRNFHRQMINKALQSIDEQKIGERTVQGTTFAMNEEDYALAQEMINKFSKKILDKLSSKDGDHVYQYNQQLFKLTT